MNRCRTPALSTPLLSAPLRWAPLLWVRLLWALTIAAAMPGQSAERMTPTGSAGAAAPPAPPVDPPQAASTRMHAAWLREVLDLDLPAAIADYKAIAEDTSPSNPERWIAVARLLELQRIGIATGYAAPFAEAPAAVRDALAAVPPGLEVTELVRRSRLDPLAKVAIQPEAELQPSLRPATGKVKAWLREQVGPSIDASMLRRLQQSRQRRDRRPVPPIAMATDIVAIELQDRQEQAANLRALYFADWRPPAIVGEPAALLTRVQPAIDLWLAEPKLEEWEKRLLRRLAQRLAEGDPAKALELLQRLPLYAERLLAEAPAAPAAETPR
jgi:hypothetical protein